MIGKAVWVLASLGVATASYRYQPADTYSPDNIPGTHCVQTSNATYFDCTHAQASKPELHHVRIVGPAKEAAALLRAAAEAADKGGSTNLVIARTKASIAEAEITKTLQKN